MRWFHGHYRTKTVAQGGKRGKIPRKGRGGKRLAEGKSLTPEKHNQGERCKVGESGA